MPIAGKPLAAILLAGLSSVSLVACTGLPVQQPSSGHIRPDKAPSGSSSIPQPVQQNVSLPKPRPALKAETYSVVVNNVPVHELLFALARDARINVDIHPGIEGLVTLNAIGQTLQQLLNRIGKLADMRWELDGQNLAVMPDSPFLRTYKIDYVNMSRDASVTMSVNSQVTSAVAAGAGGATGIGATVGGNNSLTEIRSSARNRFWETLEKNIKDILRETDKILPEGSSETVIEHTDQQDTTGSGAQPGRAGGVRGNKRSATPGQASIANSPNAASLQQNSATLVRRTTFREAASVIANPETGILSIRGTARQHEKVQEFITQVMDSARRQVLIEATIAEVQLSQNYQQGIDWQRLRSDGNGFRLTQSGTGVLTGTPGIASQVPGGTLVSGANSSLFILGYRNSGQALINFSAAVKLLESYGNVKVLSSPKLSVLNNQTALLKVVNNLVYFNVKADTTQSASGLSQTTVSTTPQSVSVGLVMGVTPQISDSDNIVLNVRPMISRVTSFKQDPNPNIPAGLSNLVPEIETREMESVMRVSNGDIAVLGGLMQDAIDYKDDAVPVLSSLPGIGNLFAYRKDTNTKTELVIFLRPVIIREPSLASDFREFREQVPDRDFFARGPGLQQKHYPGSETGQGKPEVKLNEPAN